MATPRGAPEYAEAQNLPETTGNEISRHVGAGAEHYPIVDKDLSAAPVSCDDGARYIVSGTPGGSDPWYGQSGKIAIAVGADASNGWLFATPVKGTSAYVQDEDLDYRHNGTSFAPNAATSSAPQFPLEASEDVGSGLFGNIHSSTGAKVRKANATDGTKPCDCYVPTAITSGDDGTVYGPGCLISGLSGLTAGADVWLDATGGGWTHTAPSGAGNLVQRLGKAVSSTQMFFNPQPGVVL